MAEHAPGSIFDNDAAEVSSPLPWHRLCDLLDVICLFKNVNVKIADRFGTLLFSFLSASNLASLFLVILQCWQRHATESL